MFVANCTIPFDDISERQDQEQQDFWVSNNVISYYNSFSYTFIGETHFFLKNTDLPYILKRCSKDVIR